MMFTRTSIINTHKIEITIYVVTFSKSFAIEATIPLDSIAVFGEKRKDKNIGKVPKLNSNASIKPTITSTIDIANGAILRRSNLVLFFINLKPLIGALKPKINLGIKFLIYLLKPATSCSSD